MADGNPQLDALLELERRHMSGDKGITEEQWGQIKSRLDAYRAQGLAKPLGGTRVLSSTDRKELEGNIGNYAALKNSGSSFNDDFSGNTLTGGLENSIQSLNSGFGTPGQRDWWSNFRATDNQIRNTLFGSALTDSEKRAYEETTISERMDPKIIRENLAHRAEIIRGALARRNAYFKKGGYDTEAIDALTGEYGADFAPDAKPLWSPKAPEDKGALVPTDVANKIEQGGLTSAQQTAYDAFNKANPNASADQLRAFATSMGWNLSNADDIVKARDQGGGVMPAATAIIRPPDISDVRGKDDFNERQDAFGRGVYDTATFGFGDEGRAAVKTVFEGGLMDDNLRRERAINAYDAQNSPWLRGSGQLLGGVLLPVGRGASTVGELAGVGGAAGAAYGLGSGETWEERGVNALTGGVAGAAIGAGFGKLGDIWRRRGGGSSPGGGGGPVTPPEDGLDTIATRMGITPSPATVGGRSAEALQIGLGNAPGSMGPVRAGVEQEIEGLGNFARDTASRMGPVSTPQQAGEILSRGARVADRAQARAAGRSYDARTDMMGGETAPVTMGGTQSAIRNVTADFPSNEVIGDLLTHPLIRRLEGADAPELTLGESTELLSEARRVLRRARETKQPGRLINQLSAVEQAIEGDVMRAAQASDAIAGRAAGEGAEAMQRQGDSLWADRMQAQKREFKRLLASSNDDVNTSGESVYRQMFNDMQEEGGNLVRLRRTLGRLPRQARDTFSATAFDDLGKARPGAQNADGDAWSFETFMTNWGKMGNDAKRLVFQGRGVDREISDIVRYADRLRTLNKARNFSNTGATAANASYITALVGSLFTGGPMAAAAVGATYPAMNIAGRAFMATPALRSWLRSAMQGAVRGNESQVQTLVRRLPSLAAKNPSISAEISQLERAILSAANDNGLSSAAASPERKDEQR